MHKLVLEHFQIPETITTVKPFGDGLINHSFIAESEEGKRYFIQKINTELFENVDGLMNNIVLVTEFLKRK